MTLQKGAMRMRWGMFTKCLAQHSAHSESLFPQLLKIIAETADSMDISYANRAAYTWSGWWGRIIIVTSDPDGVSTLHSCHRTPQVSGFRSQIKQVPGWPTERIWKDWEEEAAPGEGILLVPLLRAVGRSSLWLGPCWASTETGPHPYTDSVCWPCHIKEGWSIQSHLAMAAKPRTWSIPYKADSSRVIPSPAWRMLYSRPGVWAGSLLGSWVDCATLPQGLHSSVNGDLLANAAFRLVTWPSSLQYVKEEALLRVSLLREWKWKPAGQWLKPRDR